MDDQKIFSVETVSGFNPEVRIFSTEIVPGFSPEALSTILFLERKCFPSSWQYDDAEEYYDAMLRDPKNIHIFLREGESAVGYVFGKPHDGEVEELSEADPDFHESADPRYYVETIQIAPEARGCGGGKKLLLAFQEEAVRRGISKFSMHARTLNGFSEMSKKLFEEKVTLVRPIPRWEYADGEPYEYIEWNA